MSKVSDQIASFDSEELDMATQALLLHPFLPLACMADEKETIRYTNPVSPLLAMPFSHYQVKYPLFTIGYVALFSSSDVVPLPIVVSLFIVVPLIIHKVQYLFVSSVGCSPLFSPSGTG